MPSGDHQRKSEQLSPPPTPHPADSGAPPKSIGWGPGLSKLLFAFTKRHRGKAIELNASDDTMRVLGPRGEELAVVNSEVALDYLLGCIRETTTPIRPLEEVPARLKPFRVSARAGDGREYQGLCPVIGRSGIFLEVTPGPAPGTRLSMAIVSPNDVSRTLRLEGTVAWACERSDEFGFGPGVGVVCTWGSPEVVGFLADFARKREPRGAPAH